MVQAHSRLGFPHSAHSWLIADVQPVRFLDVLGMSLADLVTEGVAQQAAGAFGTPTGHDDISDAEGEMKTEAGGTEAREAAASL